ncbi:MAG: cellulase family glycosylhydrolase, partial [Flavobacteriaceae bacterium]|nr:cellulase family glycosylhydrolase [Flavobacteriaceae bacterium]
PSDASNQLDMWQKETWNPELIDKELGWAEDIGFNTIRVYLHYFPYRDDKDGFLQRMDQFLEISTKHNIKPMFIFFDDVWYPNPVAGKQPDVIPHLHNSNWMQSPGAEYLLHPERHIELKPYVQDVMNRYKDDDRVLLWDLYNEPQNTNNNSYGEMGKGKEKFSMMLLKEVFEWAREVNPSQPITSAPWIGEWVDETKMTEFHKFMFNNSDIISYHNYDDIANFKRVSEPLKRYNRPMICTEYMARGNNSLFETHLPYMAENNIGAINWGFVAGRTQTIYAWDSWLKEYTAEPELWFHDIFRQDGSVYKQSEVDLIKKLTSEKNGKK